jgi:hypothetical protein
MLAEATAPAAAGCWKAMVAQATGRAHPAAAALPPSHPALLLLLHPLLAAAPADVTQAAQRHSSVKERATLHQLRHATL